MKVSFIIASLSNATPLVKSLEKLDSEIIVTRMLGKAKSRNWAALQSKGDLLIFMDGDTMISTDHLNYVINWMREHPNSCLSAKNMIYMCTRLLAISRRNFFNLRGFNEFFDEPMDQEFGIRLVRMGIPLYHLPSDWLLHTPDNDASYIHRLRRPSENMKFLLCYSREVWASYLLRFGLKNGFLKFLARRFIHTTQIHKIPVLLGRNLVMFIYHALTLPFKKKFSSFNI